jgi:apolipoprotein N-acyltransferase
MKDYFKTPSTVAGLPVIGSLLGAVVAGAVFGAVFHLTDTWAIAIKLLCIAACFVVLRGAVRWTSGFLLGWAWGAGATLTGMGWLYVAMHDVGGMPAWMAGIAMVMFSLLLGVFNGLAGAGFVALKSKSHWIALPFAATWLLGEWLRTWVLTGLPWMSVGYGFLDTPLTGVTSSLGVLGVGAAAVLLAVCVAQLLNRQRFKAMIGAAALLVAGYFAAQTSYTAPYGAPLSVALLQGNVPQDLKFDPVAKMSYMRRYADMAAQSKAQLTVMPETALPTLQSQVPDDVMNTLKSATGTQLIGIAGELGGKYTNRMATPFAALPWVYDKSHLVPFGEVIPTGFQWFVDMMKMPLSSMGRGSEAQSNLTVNGLNLAPNICYEEIFSHEWRARGAQAHILLNISNFGWYGDSTVFAQHTNIARMRALEFQKPYLSATNNGMSVAILPTGFVQAALAKNTQGTLNIAVQGTAGETPYSRWGDWGAVVLAVFALFAAYWRGKITGTNS